MATSMNFLSPDNLCGRALLRLVARGSSIIAELNRLAARVPDAYKGVSRGDAAKYRAILFDFRYMKTPERYEHDISHNLDLVDLDDELQETHLPILKRFYQLFESMTKYIADLYKYVDDLNSGFYISNTVEGVLLDVDGKQLMIESVYLLGVMLLQLDVLVPGPVRERMIVSYLRYTGEGALLSLDEVKKLCRSTGFDPRAPKEDAPEGYPEAYFARFPPDKALLNMMVDRLRSDDIYQRVRMFPAPEHRSAALSQQASMVYVVLYFTPEHLKRNKSMMREIVDKHFNDNWIVHIYMGKLADLSEEWSRYPAAREALGIDTLQPSNVQSLLDRHKLEVEACEADLRKYLTEGVLTEKYVVDNTAPLLHALRRCNVTLRWPFLHKRTAHRRFNEAINRAVVPPERMLSLLLSTAQLEFKLKGMFAELLSVKEERWNEGKKVVSEMMVELSNYFSGEQALTRVEKDEQLQGWFRQLAGEVEALDYTDATTAGRKILQLIKALEEVEQFETIDTSTFIKEFLSQARDHMLNMVRTVNVKDEVMDTLLVVSDLAYAWEVINDYMRQMHERITRDPTCVVLLRAVFLKMTSVLDVPLIRIRQGESPDAESVGQYYSAELVNFVRRVLEIVPISVFQLLDQIIRLQTSDMRPVPVRMELIHLKGLAQTDQRYTLAKLTHRISVFTEGILAMRKTLLGDIQVDPRKILEEGIRKEAVRQVTATMHGILQFDMRTGRGRDPKRNFMEQMTKVADRLDGFQRSFAYIQDYINIYGLKLFQEEFMRVIGFNFEMECNRFLKSKVLPEASRFQNGASPLPPMPAPTDRNVGFLGRTLDAVCSLTDPRSTIYSPTENAWFDASGREMAGLALMDLFNKGVSVAGMCAIDSLLAFHATASLKSLVRSFAAESKAGASKLLGQVTADLRPQTAPARSHKVYAHVVRKLAKPMDAMLDFVLRVGQVQLLRKQIGAQLNFSCRLESKLLLSSLEALNAAVLTDIRRHYHNSEKYPYPQKENPLLQELGKYLTAVGIYDPMAQIYVTVDALPHMGLWLALFVLAQMPKLTYDRDFSSLVRRRAADGVDGAPLVAGLATVLRQLHPTVTRQLLSFLGQYVRTHVQLCFAASKPSPLPAEVVNVLLFLRDLTVVANIPRRVLEGFIPAYVFDAVSVAGT
mmetsp:Transcript_82253/g.199407  ORF Transcript_82253/g.199407 Transcript_82253/m.199407 type:complete len:1160 (-) Transcript_82253:74-3553(-)